jgi:hypothetical protein
VLTTLTSEDVDPILAHASIASLRLEKSDPGSGRAGIRNSERKLHGGLKARIAVIGRHPWGIDAHAPI